jgi:hypothetical protein
MHASSIVDIYYFHYSRRCVTCQAVETNTEKFVKEMYAKQIKEGKLKFIPINLDDKGSELVAKKNKVEGQALLVTSKNKRIDLTEQGFMYARSKPEKLKAALKEAIDPLLK